MGTYVKAKASIKSYDEAARFLGDAGKRKLALNTYVRRVTSRSIAVVLYTTNVVIYYDDGTFSVSNGGWPTITTSSRISQFTPDHWSFWHHRGQLVGSNHKTGKEIHGLNHNTKLK